MKRLLLGVGALFCLSATSALATDLPMKAPVYQVDAPFSWAGLYVGVHVGDGWGRYGHVEGDIAGSPSTRFDSKGWFGGAQIGYNSLIAPNWLLGSEVDFSGGHIRGNGIDTIGDQLNEKVDFFGTARVRLGYVINRALIYGTGGLAWANAHATIQGFGNSNEHYVGWAIGGGLEYAFDPRWSVKLEYLYSDLGNHKEATAFGGGSPFNTSDLTLSTVKLGLNYRLGDPVTSVSALPLKAAPAARFSWTGSYVGAHAGYAWSHFNSLQTIAFIVPPSAAGSVDPSAWFGGFQTGYNWQFAPTWMLGVETDNSFISLRASGLETGPGGFLFNTTLKVDDLGTVRARLGYVLDNSLIYATGGLAYAHQRFSMAIGAPIGNDIHDIGWTAGGGFEYAFNPKWSAKLEYLYADLGGQSLQIVSTDRTNLKIQTVRVGLNYKFDLGELLRGR